MIGGILSSVAGMAGGLGKKGGGGGEGGGGGGDIGGLLEAGKGIAEKISETKKAKKAKKAEKKAAAQQAQPSQQAPKGSPQLDKMIQDLVAMSGQGGAPNANLGGLTSGLTQNFGAL